MNALQLTNPIAMVAKRVAAPIRSRVALCDSELVERTKEGDDDAFDEIVRRYQNFIYRQAWGYLRDDDSAKDVTQDVFIKAYEGVRHLKAASGLRRWLYSICRNHCLNAIRKRKAERDLRPEPPAGPGPDVALRVYLKDLISHMDDPYREVIMLRYYGDLTYDEIAEVLDISVDNVKVRLFRARNRLKTMLGDTAHEM
jgi:RNA polymerase sigma-70 factor (ECF subfamily)